MLGTWTGRPPFKTLVASYQCLNPPTCEPIHINEAKLQARRATSEYAEDSMWPIYVSAARNQVETDALRAVCWQRWQLSVDRWPDIFQLYKCPVIAVESVKYLDLSATGTWITVDPSIYSADYSEPCRITNAYAMYWQPNRWQMASIQVTFTAGYLIPFTASTSGNLLTFVEYQPTNGNSFKLSNSGGSLPGGLSANTTYYIVGASGNTCQLSTTSGGGAVTITQPGSGYQFLGQLPGSLRIAMLKHIATNFADREGSSIAADCERSYLQSLRAVQYAVL